MNNQEKDVERYQFILELFENERYLYDSVFSFIQKQERYFITNKNMHDNRWKKKFNYESSFFSIHESNDAEECKEREKKEE